MVCNGICSETFKFSVMVFIYFSVGHKPIGAYQIYSGIVADVCHMTSMRAPPPPSLVPPQK